MDAIERAWGDLIFGLAPSGEADGVVAVTARRSARATTNPEVTMARNTSKQASSKATAGGKPKRRRVSPPVTKQAAIINLLKRPKGASIADLTTATGWQAHSVRAALTDLRKRDMEVVRTKGDDGSTVYRIGGSARS